MLRRQGSAAAAAGKAQGSVVEATGWGMFAGGMALELEGVVAKDIKSPYVEGPVVTWHWQKIKNRNYKRQGKREFAPPRR
jgi:ATP-dependent DNA ligase